MAGMAPREYESSQFRAEHIAIAKKGYKYLRKTLYQIIDPIIRFYPVFKKFYVLKLLCIVYHLLTTGRQFDPTLLK